MGRDIHPFIEIARPQAKTWSFWAQPHIKRNYVLFAHLIEDVRPRGVPMGLSTHVEDEYTLFVDDSPDADACEGLCSRERAESWIRSGSSRWWTPETCITHPDWHTPSWITEQEAVEISKSGHSSSFALTAACMAEIARQGYMVRLVFWFDN